MSDSSAAAPLAGGTAATNSRPTDPTIVTDPAVPVEPAEVPASAASTSIPGTVVVVTTTSRTGVERTRRSVFLTLTGAEHAVERALTKGHDVAVVAVRLVPLLALLTLAVAAPDPSVRRAFVAAVRSPRAAFIAPYLTSTAAHRRARIAVRRGWSARVVEVDMVAVDGASLDPLTLDAPDPLDEGAPPRRGRRSRRSARARLDAAEVAAAADEVVDLAAFDGQVVELDGDEDVDEGWRSA